MSEQNTAHGDPCPDVEAPHPLEGLLEPVTRDRAAAQEHALTSIAISLKRIADTMTATNEYGENTAEAVGGHIRRAGQEVVSIIHHSATSRR